MKKIVTILTLTALLGITGAFSANATVTLVGCTHHTAVTKITDTRETYQTFFTDTAELRKEIAIKRIDLETANISEPVDEVTVNSLNRELTDLQEELRIAAETTGITHYGWGYGMMTHGYGHRDCGDSLTSR